MNAMSQKRNVDAAPSSTASAVRKVYVPPRLERFGTIRELTLGPGFNNNFDGAHPPGHNKSRM